MDREKFKKLVCYICGSCAATPERLGAIKLNKSLWLADMLSFYETRKSITGARYIKRQFGPVPAAIVPIIEELKSEGTLDVIERDFHGLRKKEYHLKQSVDSNFLSDAERSAVDAAIEVVCNRNTATSISEATHDLSWRAAAEGEEIPLYTVFVRPATITDQHRAWAAEMIRNEQQTA